jgi:hypothetical protein
MLAFLSVFGNDCCYPLLTPQKMKERKIEKENPK